MENTLDSGSDNSGTEHVLAGGNVADAVVRVGDTDLATRSPRRTGRQVLEYVPDTVDEIPATTAEPHRAGRLIRDLGRRRTGSRMWDLAYAAHGFVPLHEGGDPAVDGPRLRALVDGYGVDDGRARLPALVVGHTRGMFELVRGSAPTGRQPWARLYAEGRGAHWGPGADDMRRDLDLCSKALDQVTLIDT